MPSAAALASNLNGAVSSSTLLPWLFRLKGTLLSTMSFAAQGDLYLYVPYKYRDEYDEDTAVDEACRMRKEKMPHVLLSTVALSIGFK
jgi:hypothetical protein